MGRRRSGCEDRRLPVACAQLTATRIHDQEVKIEEGGGRRGRCSGDRKRGTWPLYIRLWRVTCGLRDGLG